VVRTTAQVAYQRLLQDLKNNQTICDVFSSTDVGHYVRLAAEGRFEKYMPETATRSSDVPQLRSRGLLSHDVGRPGVLTYNSHQGEGGGSAKKWRTSWTSSGRARSRPAIPAFSGYVGTWVLTMKNSMAGATSTKLEKNKPQIGRSINDTVTALNAGERQVAAGADGRPCSAPRAATRWRSSYPTDGSVLIIAPSADHEGHQASQRRRLFWNTSIRSRRRRSYASTSPSRSAEVPSPPGANRSARSRHPATVADIDKGIPRLIESWRDTFGIRLSSPSKAWGGVAVVRRRSNCADGGYQFRRWHVLWDPILAS
jgi:iron(III) transport system substrate-binding protein